MDKNTRKTSFGKWASPINFKKFNEIINFHNQDRYTKKLTTQAYTLLMLHAHLTQTDSLHALKAALASDDLARAAGVESISVSQLSRKNNEVDPAILSNLFLQLVSQINGEKRGPRGGMPLKIIDSTTLPLNINHFEWAKFRKTKAGVKLHLRIVFSEKGTHYPDKEVITNAKDSDRNQLEVLVDDKEAMYVFDRGYMDYGQFDKFTDDALFFVCRLKRNSIIHPVENFTLPQGCDAVSDTMAFIGNVTNCTENVFRIVVVPDGKGGELRLITNRFDLTATEISEIYRSRWAIELFFKWIKQHVNIKHFYGQSENAVKNQIYLVLIAYCLNVLIQMETKSKKSILTITRLLKAKLWTASRHWLSRIENKAVP
ncbi:transposase [Planococcus salinarum]|uniref:Transposase n=1 Tax=Planococcus salinarum TaxID=622695 RepID=A0ABX3D0Z9_9BACL|nr:IS4 family transposase [Planococcus salinarum]OHX51524.1 transposase [Planococcus salinarum]TAA65635.1 IS4 family transposase [Planococcus salinarum]